MQVVHHEEKKTARDLYARKLHWFQVIEITSELLGHLAYSVDVSNGFAVDLLSEVRIIAGDVGGTKIKLSAFSLDGLSIECLAERQFRTRDYSSFEELLHAFMSNTSLAGQSIEFACFGVAGPVINGRSKLSNVEWVIDEKVLSSGLPEFQNVRVLNDLVATANYVPHLDEDEVQLVSSESEGETRRSRRAQPSFGSIAVIAPGTGLGEAFLTWEQETGRWEARASEGGHCDFAPASTSEAGLFEYLLEKFKHVSFERVCSGPGIHNISRYFHELGGPKAEDCPALSIIDGVDIGDPTPLIVSEALKAENACMNCARTLDTFVSILGAESGNLALKVLATNGVFVGGGLVLKVLPLMMRGRFMESFVRKGRMFELLSRVPVKVILTDRAALLGAARYAQDMALAGEVIQRTGSGQISAERR
ncbi:MAG TPA: glucokinase [Nitrososphaerales archaeon]|nr:glucokinase [Nitrososphaerales archaeon]